MDKVLLKYTEYNEPHESLTNKNIIEVSWIDLLCSVKLMESSFKFSYAKREIICCVV
jgi:hypothetical protein